jgi:DNA-binding GntR family transcriptional regulator
MMAGMASAYRTIYLDLRRRLANGEWGVGDQLPAIAELMDHYGTPSLNTVRAAQKLLADEGLVRSEQGRGVFVLAVPAADEATDRGELLAKVTEARRLLGEVEAALRSGRGD